MLVLETFLELFPELECEVESDLSLQFWGEEAKGLLEALGCPLVSSELYLATAHIIALKSQSNGLVSSIKNVNSSVSYQLVRTGDKSLSIRLTAYGRILADRLSLGAEFDSRPYYCWESL